jgi:hypothetical protein
VLRGQAVAIWTATDRAASFDREKLLTGAAASRRPLISGRSALIEKSVVYSIEQTIPFIALRDGEALVLDSRALQSF